MITKSVTPCGWITLNFVGMENVDEAWGISNACDIIFLFPDFGENWLVGTLGIVDDRDWEDNREAANVWVLVFFSSDCCGIFLAVSVVSVSDWGLDASRDSSSLWVLAFLGFIFCDWLDCCFSW